MSTWSGLLRELVRKGKRNPWILLLWNRYRIRKQKYLLKKYEDRDAITALYQSQLSRMPDLDRPKRFTEKIQWIKLNERMPLMTLCADKHTVRRYVANNGFADILNEVLGVWENADEIDVHSLPDRFVLKATHGSGMNLIVKDKNKVNWTLWKKIMRCWLRQNIYIDGREWPYKDIKPRILCERFIETDGEDLRDYKIFCFHGEPKVIQVDGDRFTEHKRVYYDTKWNRMPFQYGSYPMSYRAERPQSLEQMLQIARSLAVPFRFCRVDLYDVNGRILFGEITFSPDSGFARFDPDEYDLILGEQLNVQAGHTI